MINYLYVDGDTDRLVDDAVMPLRTGDTEKVDKNDDPIPRKNLLRGVDPCFLLEAFAERCLFARWRAHLHDAALAVHNGSSFAPAENASGTHFLFSRKLSTSQVQSLGAICHHLGGLAGNGWRWLDPDPSRGPASGDCTQYRDYHPEIRWPAIGDANDVTHLSAWRDTSTWAFVNWSAGDVPPLRASWVEDMFENLKLMRVAAHNAAEDASDDAEVRVRSAQYSGAAGGDPTVSYSDLHFTAQYRWLHAVLNGYWYERSADEYEWQVNGSADGYYSGSRIWFARPNAQPSDYASEADYYRFRLPPGTAFRPVIAVRAGCYASSRSPSGLYGGDGIPTTIKYYLHVGEEHTTGADGATYCEASDYAAAGQAAISNLGYDFDDVLDYMNASTSSPPQDGWYKRGEIDVTLRQFYVVAHLGDHTKWWS